MDYNEILNYLEVQKKEVLKQLDKHNKIIITECKDGYQIYIQKIKKFVSEV